MSDIDLSSAGFRGVVIQKNNGFYRLATESGERICSLSNHLRKGGDVELVVGDEVVFDAANQVTALLPRRNWISRRAAAHTCEQLIAANIDQIVPVFAAANPRPAWHLLDRYLVSAEAAEIPALVCITKLDLVAGRGEVNEIEQVAAEYRAIGYPVLLTSTASGEGVDDFRTVLRGRRSLLVGKSGVGKTSLLNALEPGLGLRVQETNSVTGKGRHTTTSATLFPLDQGGAIIDTPGIREFGLWNVDGADLAYFFPELRPYLGKCRFGMDCRHQDEPGCAVRRAVTAGQISPYRYQSYLKLRLDP
ncbi:ribosome small subunit-dependent GTPase A [Longilinea arvoryzae]|uniref:Small ribosomal subunit biogenesis GTPase RsgA n=1 Tax=Longilinea arvoryzae TaxID=360412 RepID=A0A0S7BCA5_9CHLR|nr:ribosome small subunit-dependent GTPase A [Longilinea arvoryzae]GAP12308.1 ribosome small subunit-dependent GTPase A [Longilinea arvoryzae]